MGTKTSLMRQKLLVSASAVVCATCAFPPTSAFAQPAPAQSEPVQSASAAPPVEIVVTGSRFGARTVTNSPTPIDTVTSEELSRTGGSDLQSQIKIAIPSFSTPRPAAAGVNDFLTPPTLRGLSPGEVLLLVNGKRRHTNAELSNGSQIGRGDVAYDFNAIPTIAIARVEVLRDGAAAQYGSDAIAGVIGLQLDKSLGLRATSRYGITSRGDGQDIQLAVAQGVAVGSRGFIRVSGSYQNHRHTNRARSDTRQQYFGNNNGTLVLPFGLFGSGVGLTPSNGSLDPREATVDRRIFRYGEPDYTNASVFVNSELPIGTSLTAYAFGGYSQLNGVSFNFVRRAGQDETVRSIFPNGFRPEQLSRLENASIAVGLRGKDLGGFKWDLSSVYGESTDRLRVRNSNNASLGAASPKSVLRGGAQFRQWTTNLDLTRDLDLGLSSPLKVALGAEYRREWYTLREGEPASYSNGGVPILDGPNVGRPAPAGIQSAVGIAPSDVIPGRRNSKAIYAEIEQDVGERLLLSAAIRHENYSDFGSTTNYKLAGRLSLFGGLALRGSVGTGFRAPALAQQFYSQSDFQFVSGQLLKVRILSVQDPVAALIGASPLRPERSKDISAGAVVNAGAFSATIDAYQIKLKDRIVISSNFQNPALTSFLASQGLPGIAAVAYLTNAVDTTTRGLDFTARYRTDFGRAGKLTATFAANLNRTKFNRISGTPPAIAAFGVAVPLVDNTQQIRLSRSTPKDKETLNLNWTSGKFSVGLTNTRYGEVEQVSLANVTPARVAALIPGYDVRLVAPVPGSLNRDIVQSFRADIITDMDVGYDLNEHFSLGAGVANVFNKYPEHQIASTTNSVAVGTNGADNAGILPFAYIAPYGVSGRFFYVKAGFKF